MKLACNVVSANRWDAPSKRKTRTDNPLLLILKHVVGFLTNEKDTLWLHSLESKAVRCDNVKISTVSFYVMSAIMYITAAEETKCFLVFSIVFIIYHFNERAQKNFSMVW